MKTPSCSVGRFLRVLVPFERQENSRMWQIQISKISSTCKTLDIFYWPRVVYQIQLMYRWIISMIKHKTHQSSTIFYWTKKLKVELNIKLWYIYNPNLLCCQYWHTKTISSRHQYQAQYLNPKSTRISHLFHLVYT